MTGDVCSWFAGRIEAQCGLLYEVIHIKVSNVDVVAGVIPRRLIWVRRRLWDLAVTGCYTATRPPSSVPGARPGLRFTVVCRFESTEYSTRNLEPSMEKKINPSITNPAWPLR